MSRCTTKLNHVRTSNENTTYYSKDKPYGSAYRTACGRWLSIRDQYPKGMKCATCKKYWNTKRKEEDFWMEPLLVSSITIEVE